MPGAVVIGLFCTYLIPIQAVTIVEGQPKSVSVSVRFTMLGLSRVQQDNGKCSFVNENVCTNVYDTNTIRCIQIYGGRTFWLLRLAPLKETLRGCRERSECMVKAG